MNWINLYALTSLLLCTSLSGLAESDTMIYGRVIDAETHAPLPFANIVHGHSGTTSNLDGQFVLTIHEQVDSVYIEVKYMGYKSEQLTLAAGTTDLVIAMNNQTQMLNDVKIYSAENVMADVYSHHHLNYEYEDQLLESYYKESIRYGDNYYFIAEGIFDIYLPTIYSDNEVQVRAEKTRKKEFVLLDTVDMPMFSGHVHDMVQAASRRKTSFLDSENKDAYYFSKQDLTIYDGREVFEIHFEPRTKKGTASGTLFVDSETKAVIRAEYYPIIAHQDFWTRVKWIEEYKEIDGTCYIHRVSYLGEWTVDGRTYSMEALMLVTDFETIYETPVLENTLAEEAIFFHEASSFSDTFWEGHTYIALSQKERQSLAKK
ncbi:CarboxypepD_reg-like domain-containing protein [Reichenbachiella agariperforans]|uniref:CarboxypepD_reg-like domain-containing protein n=1 Tax=Reichenbachiella agariperforans TaxID=156994 RepID=A0A1M6LQU7_REIAG|nr:carboxypeptidase-like regulatory domain-containing protein [Reichenbachiella agariperforans]SHJ73546.1 CarboxypepD_reg-like domain-containing protein [Reichenbachiella agariperforans]